MTAEEILIQRRVTAIVAASRRRASHSFSINDEKFTLKEVSKKCEVYRYSGSYGDVECSGSKYRLIERKCEAYFTGEYVKEGELECRGSDLRPIERYCSVSMYSESYGEIQCGSGPPISSKSYFHGYLCTQDCSGHEAGYQWAEEKEIDDKEDCRGKSQSFIEGCWAYVED